MLTHSYYEEDPRVRRQAEALVASGRDVDVYALRRPDDPREVVVDGGRVRHLDVQRHQGAGLGTYLREYLAFFARAGWSLLRAHRRRRYALVQVHTLPDFLVLAALPLRMAGVPVLLDLHEAMPEFFRSRFPRASQPGIHRLLLLQERISLAAATHAQTVNEALAERLVRLGRRSEAVSVVRNSPSLARFDPALVASRPFAEDGVVRLVYAGALTPTYELDVALEALARLEAVRPGTFLLDLYGRGDSEPLLRERAAQLGVADRVRFHGRVPLEAIPAALSVADIGLAPTRRDPFTDMSLSTKIFEYGAMGKPAVCSRLPMVERTFPPGTVWSYQPGDAASMMEAILAVVDDPVARAAGVRGAAALVAGMGWEREAGAYVDLVEGLIRRAAD